MRLHHDTRSFDDLTPAGPEAQGGEAARTPGRQSEVRHGIRGVVCVLNAF